jgi:H+/gluconate symporter-like permease
MIVIIGLIALIAAAVVAVAGVMTNSGADHLVGDKFGIFGQHISNTASTGQLFLYGIIVGVVGMLGLSMLLGVFNSRLASRSSRRELKGSQRETDNLRAERDRFSQELELERAKHLRAVAPSTSDPNRTIIE